MLPLEPGHLRLRRAVHLTVLGLVFATLFFLIIFGGQP